MLYAIGGYESTGAIGRTNHEFAPPKSCLPMPSEITAWWRFNGDVSDLIGGNHGTLLNGASIAAGLVGQAFKGDGIDDFALVPHSNSLNIGHGQDFTVGAWVNL